MLKNLPIPFLSEKQIGRYTKKSIHASETGTIDNKSIQEKLFDPQKHVLAIDIGGDKIASNEYSGEQGKLRSLHEEHRHKGEKNAGYLEYLESLTPTSAEAVGISVAGPVEGTRALGSPETSIFLDAFKAQYGADFAQLFPHKPIRVTNDACAGLLAGVLEAHSRFDYIHHVIYIINGSGCGGAVYTEKTLYCAEPGHVPVVAELNPFHQETPCGMFGITVPCIEKVVGGKAGIASTWQRIHNNTDDGETISRAYQEKNDTALQLYDISAVGLVHVILGMAHAFSLEQELSRTAIVCEGGVFKVPGYFKRVQEIYETYTGELGTFLLTTDFTTNACLDGAAISALLI